MKAILIRLTDDGNQTLGVMQCYKGLLKAFECKTLELPWKDNKKQNSCIPVGTYKVIKHNSPNFGKCFKVLEVPGREDILFHKGNFNKDTKGCILVGKDFIDVNEDGTTDITSSTLTFETMLMHLPESFELTII
jgi:hypothetical protein